MSIPVYTLPRVPGATDTAEWTTFCQKRPFVVIDHQTTRSTSRWQGVPRKKQFRVSLFTKSGWAGFDNGTFYHTLADAERAAKRMAAEYVEQRLAISDAKNKKAERETAIGNKLIEILNLRVKQSNGRVDTTWGDKTPLGLYLTVKRILDEAAHD